MLLEFVIPVKCRFVQLIGFFLLLGTGYGATDCIVSPAEKDVMRSVIANDLAKQSGGIVVYRQTDSSHFSRVFDLPGMMINVPFAALAEQLKTLPEGSTAFFFEAPKGSFTIPLKHQAELQKAYDAQLKHPCDIPNDLATGSNVRSWSKELEALWNKKRSDAAWCTFENIYGKNTALVGFSRVAFDQSRKFAMVHVSSSLRGFGQGRLFLLALENHKWIVKEHFDTWLGEGGGSTPCPAPQPKH